jgi:hypothetical protein
MLSDASLEGGVGYPWGGSDRRSSPARGRQKNTAAARCFRASAARGMRNQEPTRTASGETERIQVTSDACCHMNLPHGPGTVESEDTTTSFYSTASQTS